MRETTPRDLFPGALGDDDPRVAASSACARVCAGCSTSSSESNNLLQVEEGSLYPACSDCESEAGEGGGVFRDHRKVRTYQITASGLRIWSSRYPVSNRCSKASRWFSIRKRPLQTDGNRQEEYS